MKKLLFGISLMFSGTVGVLALLICAVYVSQNIGQINGSSNCFLYLNIYGLTVFFCIFVMMGVIGLLLCIIDLLGESH